MLGLIKTGSDVPVYVQMQAALRVGTGAARTCARPGTRAAMPECAAVAPARHPRLPKLEHC